MVSAVVVAIACLLVLRLAATRSPLRQTVAAAEAAGTYAFRGSTSYEGANGSGAFLVSGAGRTFAHLSVTVAEASARPTAAAPSLGEDGPSVEYEIDWPEVSAQGEDVPEPAMLALQLPLGDPLALAAAGSAAMVRGPEPIGGQTCERVDFLVAGRAYDAILAGHPGALPVNPRGGDRTKLEGEGSVWIDRETRRPCRIKARVALPRFAGEHAGTGFVDWTYAWGP
jgi:hypothetical protein